MSSDVSIRPARRSDAAEIVLLLNIAGHSLPEYVWANFDVEEDSESPLETGRLRVMQEKYPLSYTGTELAVSDDEVVGLLLGRRNPDAMEPNDPSSGHPVFAPLASLSAEAAGTWYIDGIAVYPRWRYQGVGSQLMHRAEEHAAETAARGLSLVTTDGIPETVRFYERHGYEVRSERPFVPYPGGPDGKRWLLMVKE